MTMRPISRWEYIRPFPPGLKSEAVTGGPGHVGPFSQAVDFLMPEGSPVLAPRAGEVAEIKDDSDRGGDDQKYVPDANYITLFHGEEEFSDLVHLKHKGAIVRLGEKVVEGQLIGYSGNTGWSSQPHLHFMVFQKHPDGSWESVKIRFKE